MGILAAVSLDVPASRFSHLQSTSSNIINATSTIRRPVPHADASSRSAPAYSSGWFMESAIEYWLIRMQTQSTRLVYCAVRRKQEQRCGGEARGEELYSTSRAIEIIAEKHMLCAFHVAGCVAASSNPSALPHATIPSHHRHLIPITNSPIVSPRRRNRGRINKRQRSSISRRYRVWQRAVLDDDVAPAVFVVGDVGVVAGVNGWIGV